VSEVRTLVLGEALIDVVRSPDGAVAEHPGGSPANVALGLARLGHPVSLRTSIGSDDRGALIAAHLEPEGVELAAGSRTDGPTSVAEATIDATGAATYRFELGWEVAPPVSVDGATHLHTGSIAATLEPGATAVLDAVERARTGATVSYDPNARPSLMGQPQDVRAKRRGRALAVRRRRDPRGDAALGTARSDGGRGDPRR
jgi:fructokinase